MSKAQQKQKVREKKPSVLVRLMAFMGPRKGLLPLSMLLSALSAALHVIPFVAVWMVARTLLTGAPLADVTRAAWIAFGGEALSLLLYFAALLCSHYAAFHVEVGMQKVGMEKLMHMPLGFFDLNQSGKMRKIINDGATSTHAFLAHQLPDLAGAMVSPFAILVLCALIEWRMGLAMLLPVVIGFAVMGMMVGKSAAFQRDYQGYLEKMSAQSVEYVRGIPVVKTFGQSVYAYRAFYESILKYKELALKYTLSFRTPWSLTTTIMQTCIFFLMPVALFMAGGSPLGKVMADYVFYVMISPIFITLMMKTMYVNQNTMQAGMAIDRFDSLFDYPQMAWGKTPVHTGEPAIEFRGVTFTYPGAAQPAVKDVSFTVKKGQTVALVGMSGGGKTTVARLAARFWDADSGEVLLSGVSVKDYPKEQLMDGVSFVFQNTRLMKMSLRDNICFEKPDATPQEIDRALEQSQSREIVDRLPQGLDTVIGTRGTYLSGGEQQRIALARALVKDAPIVIMDEATAFADPENEHLITQALKTIRRDKTTLMIAHRLSSIVDADQILVMDHGMVAESGTHEALLRQGGIYSRMWADYQRSINWKIA